MDARTVDRPADRAALLLFRIGFGMLAVAAPTLAIFSRRSLTIVAPVGAALLVLSLLMSPAAAHGFERLRRLARTPAALAAAFLLAWAALSLLWTPHAGAGAERLLRIVGLLALTALAIAALPERMRASNLYLSAVGVFIACPIAILGEIQGPPAFNPLAVERAAIFIALLAWPATLWLSMKRRSVPAMAIAAGVGTLALLAQGVAMLPALLVGAVLLGGAINNARGAATAFMAVAAALLLTGPGLALLASSLSPQQSGFLKTMQVWGDVIIADPLRLLTGHGIETALRNRISLALDVDAPKSLVFEVWYEFGLLGALAMTVIVGAGIRGTLALSRMVAPFALGAIGFVFALAVTGLGTSQTWWMTAALTTAIVFAGVARGEYRTERPKAAAQPQAAEQAV